MSDFQDDDEFDGADDKFKEASAEENAFDGARAEESAERARSHRAGNLAGYAVGTANEPKEDKEEENASGNCKKPARNPVGGSHGWEEESAARAHLQMAGNLAIYATGTENDPEDY